ncbi:CPBP family intramembrane glutamic endopeptidase [Halomonas sp. PAMB 3264]|uniref:CPBP family intramembrane glutamic endopeptidase n=1 Tax=unclassified Halomonas TaxID=2609666 RepID=UPI00289A409B|nr:MULTISPECIES: CPBP family intramembrane glutamic endopeptidase [unclassified Halomonas]WNL40003.1 CPBP family intramembrane glutamic endopeptidase [Halomonas sp. PAMB 3232]WNL43311.1 CPBP family intramembrane glutamic endopeptidase [Halomonas sp. PAMB 3264]
MENLRSPSRLRLIVEMGTVFVAAPVLMAFIATPGQLFPSILPLLGLGLVLLHMTPDFRWSSILHGWRETRIPLIAAAGLATFIAGWAAIQWLQPWATFWLWREERSVFWGLLVAYPLLSALPQELIYRTLFFRRYAAILPTGRRSILLNATLFALAHVMFWNWVVLLVTFMGGLLFAVSYRQRGLVEAWALHGLTGFLLFVTGVGWYFTPEASARPF